MSCSFNQCGSCSSTADCYASIFFLLFYTCIAKRFHKDARIPAFCFFTHVLQKDFTKMRAFLLWTAHLPYKNLFCTPALQIHRSCASHLTQCFSVLCLHFTTPTLLVPCINSLLGGCTRCADLALSSWFRQSTRLWSTLWLMWEWL